MLLNSDPTGNRSAPPAPIRVLIVSAYQAMRAGLRAMLDGHDGLLVVGEAAALGDGGEVELSAVDIVVAQIDNEAAAAEIQEASAQVPLVLLARRAESLAGAFETGGAPRGYLVEPASAEEIAATIAAVAQGLIVLHPATVHEREQPRFTAAMSEGTSALTPREQEVLALVAAGLPNKGIALQLKISEHTVKFHVGAILGKLGAASRTEAVTLAVRGGMLPL